MGLQDSFSRVTKSVPFGFTIPKPNRYRNCGKGKHPTKGFASMPPARLKKIQRMGAINSHKGPKHLRCHEFTSEEARHHALIRWGKIPKGTPFVQPSAKGK